VDCDCRGGAFVLVSYACAKFILAGEHSVLSKGVGLAFPLKALTLKANLIEEPSLVLNGKIRSIEDFQKVNLVWKKFSPKSEPCGFSIESQIPLGAGLGSSAALCVALARLAGIPNNTVASQALEGEKLFHGTPSGIDPYTISLERPIRFRANPLEWSPLNTEAFQKSGHRWVLSDSGERHSTRAVLESLQHSPENFKSRQELIDELSSLSETMGDFFESGNITELGRSMNKAHECLAKLGVSTPTLETRIESLKMRGALGAKLTGAGQGGFALALVPPDFTLKSKEIWVDSL
jgi:mevalonate kinase